VDRLTFGRRIGVHDLEHGSTRLRVEGFIGHKQCRPRRQYSIDPSHEVGRHFDSGNGVRIYLGSLFSDVPGHPDSQPTKFGLIGNVGIGHAARAFGEHQCVIDERRVSLSRACEEAVATITSLIPRLQVARDARIAPLRTSVCPNCDD
jgi:hypothetical protein